MGRLVRVLKGEWTKSRQSVWTFHEDPTAMPHAILVRENEPVDSLRTIVRGVLNVTTQTPISITFQLPEWMLKSDGETCPPYTIKTTGDVHLLMSVHSWNTDPTLCVIMGSEHVAKYEFICRAPFTIGARTFLADEITEEEHLASVRGKAMKTLHESYGSLAISIK